MTSHVRRRAREGFAGVEPALDLICPLHLTVGPRGIIRHVGPTLRRLHPDLIWEGSAFFDLFEICRPNDISSTNDLRAASGKRLHLRMRGMPEIGLKGVAAAYSDGAIIDLSFGIEAVNAITTFDLTSRDFSPTDLTIEMLYLLEAKTLVMDELRTANLRLRDDKLAAEQKASTDALTGLWNRRALNTLMHDSVAAANDVALIYLDLDHFKEINDHYGHDTGDRILQHTAEVLVAETRRADIVARFGGDEFVVLMHQPKSAADAIKVVERILGRLNCPICVSGKKLAVSGSIGVAWSPNYDKPTIEHLRTYADRALYAAKDAGRGTYALHQPGEIITKPCD
ncbi:diguanylate cyclase (GGDEF) domain-containing protein [Poseidonocella pacifica]|uniref:Diguanylate cyclase (GGDEF) domain-containing protein n=1 Tax=Poseidonocella pacifica TaxID=871651 RepID=A0A1I0V4J4_9RHOB|nr:GGDEF domain-containing protein [Poseidonocella pacifica]SFA71245.1 diguanylate cyclase (GGDEF) domain-containing protein [Poseidonocella pacifica]